MTDVARKLLGEILALSEDDRVEIASEVLASLGGPPRTPAGREAWVAELERRDQAAAARGTPAPEWAEVRARILARSSTK